jgi:hypothetical protein
VFFAFFVAILAIGLNWHVSDAAEPESVRQSRHFIWEAIQARFTRQRDFL